MAEDNSAALKALIDAAGRHLVYLSRYERGLLRRILKLLGAADARLIDQLMRQIEALRPDDIQKVTTPNWTTARLKKLLDHVRAIAQVTRDILNGTLAEELKGLAEHEAEQARLQTEGVTKVNFEVDTVAPSQLRAAVTSRPFLGTFLKDEIAKLSTAQAVALQRAIREGFMLGETIQQMRKRLQEEGFVGPARNIETLVRTAVAHTSTTSREAMYSENADLIKGVKWVSVLDSRTSAVCRARDGKVYALGKGPRPPAHPNCRSTTVPVMKTWAELGVDDMPEQGAGTRPSVGAAKKAKEVPATTTYQSWLKTQPRWFVEDVLGKTKAKLYLDGKLTLDRFVDPSGKEYTLDQLRAREKQAFVQAGLA